MRIIPVPVLNDNYSYLLIDDQSQPPVAAVVDCVEPQKILDVANKESLDIKYILTTHHHLDHCGGNQGLLNLLKKDITVYGGDSRIQAITKEVSNNDVIQIGSLSVRVLSSPAHTTGHVLYYVEEGESKNIFTGDTLFIGGCGRLFEGDPSQMYHALYNVIGSLDNNTKVWVGHEYTYKNLLFAKSIEPNNKDLTEMLEWSKEQTEKKLPTIPSSIGREKTFNPFMRVHLDHFKDIYKHDNPTEPSPPTPQQVLGHIRKLKDNF